MSAASQEADAIARKNETIFLQRLASVGLKAAADAAEVDESTISRWKEKLIAQMSRVLARLGLKIVPASMHCYPPEEIEALRVLARRSDVLSNRADQLDW